MKAQWLNNQVAKPRLFPSNFYDFLFVEQYLCSPINGSSWRRCWGFWEPPPLGQARALSSLYRSWSALPGITTLGVSDNILVKAPGHWLLPGNGSAPSPVHLAGRVEWILGSLSNLGGHFQFFRNPQKAPPWFLICQAINDNCLSSVSMSYDEVKQDYSVWRKQRLKVLEQHKCWVEAGRLLLTWY